MVTIADRRTPLSPRSVALVPVARRPAPHCPALPCSRVPHSRLCRLPNARRYSAACCGRLQNPQVPATPPPPVHPRRPTHGSTHSHHPTRHHTRPRSPHTPVPCSASPVLAGPGSSWLVHPCATGCCRPSAVWPCALLFLLPHAPPSSRPYAHPSRRRRRCHCCCCGSPSLPPVVAVAAVRRPAAAVRCCTYPALATACRP